MSNMEIFIMICEGGFFLLGVICSGIEIVEDWAVLHEDADRLI